MISLLNTLFRVAKMHYAMKQAGLAVHSIQASGVDSYIVSLKPESAHVNLDALGGISETMSIKQLGTGTFRVA